MQEDACQLACLAAELRLATLVDAAAGSSAAALRVQAALHALFARLMEAGPLLMRQAAARGDGADASAECTYLAWLLEALRCAVGYLAATNAQQVGGVGWSFGAAWLHKLCKLQLGLLQAVHCWQPAHASLPSCPSCAPQGDDAVLGQLPARLVTLLARTARHGVFGCAAPALGALCDLQELWGRGQGAGEREPVGPEQLEELVPALAAYQQRPELAPAVAALIPSLASCDVPHTHLVHAALAAAPPLLQHLGMEALRRYARLCPAASLLAALPPALKDPGGLLLAGGRDAALPGGLLLQRLVGGLPPHSTIASHDLLPSHPLTLGAGTGQALPGVRDVIAQYVARTPNGAWQVDPEEAAAWAAALRQEALGAAPALRRAVEALRARAEAACNGSPPEAASNGAALAAAQQVASSIQAAEAALAAAPLDPAAAQVLQQCSARLAQLLGQVA